MSAGGEARRLRWIVVVVALVISGVVGAANAHLVYVAIASQPACVDHIKDHGVSGSFRAAKSAC